MLAAGLLIVALTAALITFLIDSGDAAEKGASPAATSRTKESNTTTTNSPATTTTPAPTTTTTTAQQQQPPPPQTQQQTQQQGQQPGPATPDAAISSYYTLVLTDRDQAWSRLTAKFQARPAGGRSGYDRWWNTISSVTASNVTLSGTNVVEATILYNKTNGERWREQHRYTLVQQNGMWLIDTVVIESSTPL